MDSTFFNYFFIFFFIWGQNSFEFKKQTILNKIIQHIPRLILFFLTIHISFESFTHIPFNDKSDFIVFIIIMLFEIILSILVLTESIFLSNFLIKSKRKFKKLENMLKIKLNVEVLIKLFEWNYLAKFILSFILFSISILSVRVDRNFDFCDLLIFLVSNYKHITAFHILIYVDYLQYIFHIVNKHLDTIQSNYTVKVFDSSAREIYYLLKTYKYIHFEIWKISQLINKRFGLILIALVLAFTLKISSSAYWTVVYWLTYRRGATMIRNYEYNFFNFCLFFSFVFVLFIS